MLRSYGSGRAIEIRNPDLRSVFLGRHKRKPLPIRCPARAIRILIGDDFPFSTFVGLSHPTQNRGRVGRPIISSIVIGVPHVSVFLGDVGITVW